MRCRKCGAEVGEGKKYCPNCGAKMEGTRGRGKVRRRYVALGVLAFLGVTAWAFKARVVVKDGEVNVRDGVFDMTPNNIPLLGRDNIKKIVIPENVTEIGVWAFRDCDNLTAIKIPESITEIGSAAFAGCRSLTEIKIPESVTVIRVQTFTDCRSLTEIKIPESVTAIEMGAFRDCDNLTAIKIPESITEIEGAAFAGCRSLTEIKIPESVTEIKVQTFADCRSLTEIKIPESVTVIEWGAFQNCSGLAELKIPENVEYIGENIIEGCSNIQTFEIPPVMPVGSYGGVWAESYTFSLEGCDSLKKIVAPHEWQKYLETEENLAAVGNRVQFEYYTVWGDYGPEN